VPDRALQRHHKRALGAHADLDNVACVHGLSRKISPSSPAKAGTHNH
jgi:hypothetical protein